jgi:hypothetical protein
MSTVFFEALVDPRGLPLFFGPAFCHDMSKGGSVRALAWAGAGAGAWAGAWGVGRGVARWLRWSISIRIINSGILGSTNIKKINQLGYLANGSLH